MNQSCLSGNKFSVVQPPFLASKVYDFVYNKNESKYIVLVHKFSGTFFFFDLLAYDLLASFSICSTDFVKKKRKAGKMFGRFQA